VRDTNLESDKLDGYIARKQTHLHKLAMVLAASQSNNLVITVENLIAAEVILKDTERDLDKVFSRIGRSEESLNMERFLEIIKRRHIVAYDEAYRLVMSTFPDFRDFEGMIQGCINAKFIKMETIGTLIVLKYMSESVRALGVA
jgi:hypothetical protein